MIFVTVGTHEQPFNRLVAYMDKWAGEHDEKVVMQTGFSTYEPGNCEFQNMFPRSKMDELIDEARILISHGGPSSFMPFLLKGKHVIVVPRQFAFEEHVNDHQILFCDEFSKQYGGITVVKNIEDLGSAINNLDTETGCNQVGFKSNNIAFCEAFTDIVNSIM